MAGRSPHQLTCRPSSRSLTPTPRGKARPRCRSACPPVPVSSCRWHPQIMRPEDGGMIRPAILPLLRDWNIALLIRRPSLFPFLCSVSASIAFRYHLHPLFLSDRYIHLIDRRASSCPRTPASSPRQETRSPSGHTKGQRVKIWGIRCTETRAEDAQSERE